MVENGRPRLVFGGVDASGHRSVAVQAASPQLAAGRSASVGTDTLKLFWKGKRLVVLPIASLDSTGIVLRVDTSWSDDQGIPWNPAIAYGTLLDSRDGKSYRTVVIGTQRWMAENLNSKVDSSWWFKGIDSTRLNADGGYDSLDENLTQGARFGRYYTWTAATGTPDSCERVSTCTIPAQGTCPSGWHLPYHEWDSLGIYGDSTAGKRLSSTSGWGGIYASEAGQDLWGFRALPPIALVGGKQVGRWIGGWWTPGFGTYGGWLPGNAYYFSLDTPNDGMVTWAEGTKRYGLSIRCVENAP